MGGVAQSEAMQDVTKRGHEWCVEKKGKVHEDVGSWKRVNLERREERTLVFLE